MIGHCQHGPQRRQWLRTLGWQVRPTLRRICRRLIRGLPHAVLFALAIFGTLCLLALAMSDPIERTGPAMKKPVSAPAVQAVRRMT